MRTNLQHHHPTATNRGRSCGHPQFNLPAWRHRGWRCGCNSSATRRRAGADVYRAQGTDNPQAHGRRRWADGPLHPPVQCASSQRDQEHSYLGWPLTSLNNCSFSLYALGTFLLRCILPRSRLKSYFFCGGLSYNLL